MSAKPFLDTNVILYLLSEDTTKADRAEALLAQGGTVSVQVLNEAANVMTRKLKMGLDEAEDILMIFTKVV
jgi:predicted nucleic acid-binding protein